MNASIFVTSLTAVMILLTGTLSWADESDKKLSKVQCEANCPIKIKTELENCDKIALDAYKKDDQTSARESKSASCRNEQMGVCRASCPDNDSPKEVALRCETATKDWKETAGKSAGACDDFEKVKSGDNTCEARIKACEKKISDTARLITTTPGGAASTGSMDVLLQFYAQKNGIDPKQFNRDGELLNTTNCVKFSNDKVEERKEKQETKLEKIDDKIKELKRKIADHEKDIAKENENLRKEISSLDEEKEKIQTTFAKTMDEYSGKLTDKYAALNKSIQENLIKVRNINNAIVKRKEDLERLKFEYNQNMMNFMENKVSSKCDEAVRAANSCFTRLNKGEKIDSKDPNCGGLSATGRGITGTGVLRTRLTQIRDACFENFTNQSNGLKFDYQTKVTSIQQDIMEKQSQVADVNKAVVAQNKEFESTTAQIEKEKGTETTSKEKKESNLATKLDGLTKTINEKIANSQKQIEVLTKEIEELVARKLPSALGIVPDAEGNNVTVSFKEARKAIEAAELSRTDAFDKCDCEKNPGGNKICTKLKDAATSAKNERGRSGVTIKSKR